MDNTVRIVMVGKTGVGKSATGNTILGSKAFYSMSSATSVTRACASKQGTVCGKTVTLVDTPGLFDTSFPAKVIEAEIGKCVNMVAPGPHVFFIVVSVGRFTKEEQHAAHVIKQIFGDDVNKFSIVLITRGDDLEADGMTAGEYYNNAGQELRSLIDHCGGRYHAINNRSQNPAQVIELMRKVESLMTQNGTHYTSALFEMAAQLREKERQLEEERNKKDCNMEVVMKLMMEMQKQNHQFQMELMAANQRANSCTIL